MKTECSVQCLHPLTTTTPCPCCVAAAKTLYHFSETVSDESLQPVPLYQHCIDWERMTECVGC